MNEPESQELPGTAVEPVAPELEQLMQSLAERYLERLQDGELLDRSALVAQLPHLADTLNRRLRLVELMHGSTQNGAAGAGGPAGSEAGPTRFSDLDSSASAGAPQ